jgi:hypothetical protein
MYSTIENELRSLRDNVFMYGKGNKLKLSYRSIGHALGDIKCIIALVGHDVSTSTRSSTSTSENVNKFVQCVIA